MDCFSVLIVSSLVFGLMTYGIVLLVQHDYRKERNKIQIERDELSRLLDRANRSMSEVAAVLEKVTKERDDANYSLTDLKTNLAVESRERDKAVAELEKVTKERDILRNSTIFSRTESLVELRDKLRDINGNVENLIQITVDLLQ